jgi:hypothetical protein
VARKLIAFCHCIYSSSVTCLLITVVFYLLYEISALSNNVHVLSRDQGNMLSYTLWPVFRFTSDFGGEKEVGIFVDCILQFLILELLLTNAE